MRSYFLFFVYILEANYIVRPGAHHGIAQNVARQFFLRLLSLLLTLTI